jgi:SAM-dependent methyltransferase
VAPGEVIGIDIGVQALEQARALALARGVGNVRFEKADVYALPYPAASFDVVFSHSLVSHLREPTRALAEMRRILRPGGIAAVIDNDPGTYVVSPPGSAMKRFTDLFVLVQEYNGGNRLLSRDLRTALLEAGFDRVEVYPGGDGSGTPEQTRSFGAACVSIASSADFRQTVLSHSWATLAELDELPAALISWGELPNAFHGVLKCGALGWADP